MALIEYDAYKQKLRDLRPELDELSAALDREGCQLLAAQERDESLESYFINLVGGGSRD